MLNYQKLQEDLYIVRIGQRYFQVNELTFRLIRNYSLYKSIDEIASVMNISVEDAEDYYNQLSESIKNVEYNDEDMFFDRPIKAQWRVTSQCNMKCRHCYLGEKDTYHLDGQDLNNIVDKFVNGGILEVTVSGGEPLIVKELPYLVKKMIDNGIMVMMFTNGTLLPEFLEKMGDISQKSDLRLTVSLDGFKDTHEYIRGEGTYEATIKGIKKAVEMGYMVNTNTTLTAKNYSEVADLIKYCRDLGVHTAQISNLVNIGSAVDNLKELEITKEQQDCFVESMRKISNVIGSNFRFLYSPIPHEEISPHSDVFEISNGKMEKVGTDSWQCGAGRGKATITHKGEVLCCPFMKEYNLGNILEKELEEIWASPKRKNFVNYLQDINGRNRICAALKGFYNVI